MPEDRLEGGGWPSLDDPWPDWWPVEYRVQYRGWWVWKGISDLVYARLMLSSPPRVVRAENPEALKDEIKAEIAKIEAKTFRVHSPGAI